MSHPDRFGTGPQTATGRVALRAARLALGGLAAITLATAPATVSSAATVEPSTESHDLEPWEPEDAGLAPGMQTERPRTLTQAIGLELIHWYQRDIATRSVSRCPFLISCSNYAARAVERHGLLAGICFFIDRNLYRENAGMAARYSLVEGPDGALRLDDGFFLMGGR